MTGTKAEAIPKSMNILLFRASGVLMGLDSEQVASIRRLEGADADNPLWIHEAVSFGDREREYSKPRLIYLRDGLNNDKCIASEEPEGFLDVEIKDIMPLGPAFTEGSCPFWGAVSVNGEVALIADFFRLAGSNAEGENDKG